MDKSKIENSYSKTIIFNDGLNLETIGKLINDMGMKKIK